MTDETTPTPTIQPLIISAPFGNYIQPPGTTATLGTFTTYRRGGWPARIWRILYTVRWNPFKQRWRNRIGLRNPGIDWLVEQVNSGKKDVSDKIVSIHGMTNEEWGPVLDKCAALKPMAIELNISCPNVGHISWPEDLFERAVATGISIIVKIPPVQYGQMVDDAVAAGVRMFHCCNTLPSPKGGVSGAPLREVALECIADLRNRPDWDELTVIGGGGVYQPEHVDAYAELGVRYVAIATKLFNPLYLLKMFGGIAGIKARAEARLS